MLEQCKPLRRSERLVQTGATATRDHEQQRHVFTQLTLQALANHYSSRRHLVNSTKQHTQFATCGIPTVRDPGEVRRLAADFLLRVGAATDGVKVVEEDAARLTLSGFIEDDVEKLCNVLHSLA